MGRQKSQWVTTSSLTLTYYSEFALKKKTPLQTYIDNSLNRVVKYWYTKIWLGKIVSPRNSVLNCCSTAQDEIECSDRIHAWMRVRSRHLLSDRCFERKQNSYADKITLLNHHLFLKFSLEFKSYLYRSFPISIKYLMWRTFVIKKKFKSTCEHMCLNID